MKHRNDGGSGNPKGNVLNFKNRKSGSTENAPKTRGINRAEWARKFIRRHRLSKADLRNSDAFRQLSDAERQAIRYQLRKQLQPEETGTGDTGHVRDETNDHSDLRDRAKECIRDIHSRQQEGKTPEPGRGALEILPPFMRFVVGCWATIFLLNEATNYYIAKGMLPVDAKNLAYLVEAVIIAAAVSRQFSVRIFAYLFLIYNSITFSVQVYRSDEGMQEVDNRRKARRTFLRQEVAKAEKSKNRYTEALSVARGNLARMAEQRMFTKGQELWGSQIAELSVREGDAERERLAAAEALRQFEAKVAASPSAGNSGVGFDTWVLIIFRWMLQLASIRFFHGFGDALTGMNWQWKAKNPDKNRVAGQHTPARSAPRTNDIRKDRVGKQEAMSPDVGATGGNIAKHWYRPLLNP